MIKKGKAWVAQVQRIAKVTRGVPPHLIRRLYLAVAVPKIMYAADICFESSRTVGGAGSTTVVAKLAAVQRKAAIAITGTMKTTATDVLDAHANLLPMQLLVEKMRARAAIRMATLPKSHPLEQHIRRVATRRIKRHPAPIHGLLHDFGVRPTDIEKIDPALADSVWKAGFRVRIAGSKEDAIAMDDADPAVI
jgi:hypothetical protein